MGQVTCTDLQRWRMTQETPRVSGNNCRGRKERRTIMKKSSLSYFAERGKEKSSVQNHHVRKGRISKENPQKTHGDELQRSRRTEKAWQLPEGRGTCH